MVCGEVYKGEMPRRKLWRKLFFFLLLNKVQLRDMSSDTYCAWRRIWPPRQFVYHLTWHHGWCLDLLPVKSPIVFVGQAGSKLIIFVQQPLIVKEFVWSLITWILYEVVDETLTYLGDDRHRIKVVWQNSWEVNQLWLLSNECCKWKPS